MEGFVELDVEKLKTPEGIAELTRMLRKLFQMVPRDGKSIRVYHGFGTPEGAVVANVGSLFLRADGGENTSLYVKETGTGATGWVAPGNWDNILDVRTSDPGDPATGQIWLRSDI